ncbi:DUF3344 domain-containing protein [Streptomyces sp. NPDC093970]|uniref:DUF3344 domain-containing protein n=1 Tax=Streptomyces sp. NPDC093970 TaxID=3155076 RepID=UPI00342ABDD5
MRIPLGPPLRRASVSVLALAAVWAPGTARATAPAAPPSPEAPRIPFAERYHAVQRGGIVRAANASVSCRTTADDPAGTPEPADPAQPPCEAARAGRFPAVNGDFDMSYVDVDDDPDTYNSSRAEVRLPEGARVTYARLYWGGNLLAGEQKPAADDGRVLVAEPGGRYKELLADTVVGHRTENGADAFQASAEITDLVRSSGSGLWTVGQVNIAKGRSGPGAWGGWTLVVAYRNPAEPLRTLALWDGFDSLDRATEVRLNGLRVPRGAGGRVGLVAYNGDRGGTGDSLTCSVAGRIPTALADSTGPADDVLDSTINDPGPVRARREPAYDNTLGYDSDVFDLGTALAQGGDQLTFRLVSQRDAAWAGALFAAVDVQ